MSDVTPPQAGWYADPENAAGERWWNGSGWSDHRRDATADTVVAPAVPAPADTGFSFGSPATAAARPDPYAAPGAPQAYSAAPGLYTAPAAPAYAPAPAYASPPAYAPAPYGAAPASTNGLALAGLIVSAAGWIVLGALAAIAGIVLSGLGLARARQAEAAGMPNSGRGLAMAGLVVGIIVLVLNVLVGVIYIAFVLSAGSGY